MKTAKEDPAIRFHKVAPDTGLIRTAYEVFVDSKSMGFVWSREGFSYRGMEGWNRGIRLKDFHPIEWRYGKVLGDFGRTTEVQTRAIAADRLTRMAGGSE